jgi:hypothetical protein
LWVAGDSGIVLVSTNGGTNWNLRSPVTSSNFRSIFSRGSGVAYVVGDSGSCFYSDDLGLSWESRTVPTNENLNCGIGPVSGTSTIALVGGTGGVIFKTTDSGVNWIQKNSRISENINAFGFGGGGQLFAAGNNGAIIFSSDAGESWSSVSSPTSQDLYSIDASGQNSNWIIASGSSGIIIKSTDNGTNWFVQSTPTNENLYCALAASNSEHLAGGSNGILLKTTDGGGDPVSVEADEINPANFKLMQNYPNPFNPTTKIIFTIPFVTLSPDQNGINSVEGSFVTLKVYDVLGNEVATLVDEKLTAGKYQINFDASNLSTGMYFYKLTSVNFRETKKMILVK